MRRLKEARGESKDDPGQRDAPSQVIDCHPVEVIIIAEQDDAPDDEGANRQDYCQPKNPPRQGM
jgi:hypothetical protein